ncbi:ABC transporter permease [Malikia granosa]|uniref:ABC transporter permease n=1 Tax=Malikia granosa TaxID=263067 RepID=A0A2S9K9M8_9BURK|nr:MlaE family lipid ABC transporter permease subunit [Malikia granosa]PRD67169.1 ABC transporter permease [Malikia granosa]
MSPDPRPGQFQFTPMAGAACLRLSGDWTLAHHGALARQLQSLQAPLPGDCRLDCSALGALDTAGASLLHQLLGSERLQQLADDSSALAPERRALLAAVVHAMQQAQAPAAAAPTGSALGDLLEQAGRAMQGLWRHGVGLSGFIGLTLETGLRLLPRPRRWRLTAFAAQLESTGLDAVPIVALLTFLVGAVVAFLGATVLSTFGASLYTVHLVAFSFLRELGVLLAAILVAGRTASAFAAQIGSMRADEEIDALRVMGLDPVELLVLPRVLALLVALPILGLVAVVSGITGGMLVCALQLDISPAMFLSVLEHQIGLRHFVIGLSKAPLFAFLIAVIGCLEGFKVAGSAQSVGEHTTSAVVQSIFVVILVDAVAALFFMEMGW